MKLRYAPQSPYVRKVMIVAHELGLVHQIEIIPTPAHPVDRNSELVSLNPLGQIPALELADRRTLYDSRVICEYLNDLGKGSIFPSQGPARWHALTLQALGDGMLASALLARYEVAARPPQLQWTDWMKGHLAKSESGLAALDKAPEQLGEAIDIGTITIACALGYLDFRFPDLGWRDRFPRVAKWEARFGAHPSLAATRPT